MSLKTTPNERRVLEALATDNPDAKPGEPEWWSARSLIAHHRGSMGNRTVQGIGRTCAGLEAKGMTRGRHVGGRGHGWHEYRLSALGRGLVSDEIVNNDNEEN